VAQAQQQPRNAAVRFRLAAALAAARRCDTATAVALAAQPLAPDNVLGPLVVGGCQEQAGRYDAAIATYAGFAEQHPRARGVAALRAKAELALRASAERTARQALAREAELAQQSPEPRTLAVLPVVVAGDSTLRPLSRGLAELMTTDLAYIRTLRLLERLQIGVLLDELKLAQGQAVDPATAARVGRLLRAERMVQGVLTIPSQRAPVRLSASVVAATGVVRPIGDVTGPFKDLLGLEKRVVLDLAAQLGIQLTEAERQQILKQGPKNLAAFLAYSRGLEAMDRGDYSTAARQFQAAAQADPGFRAARQGQEAAQAAPIVQHAAGGAVVTVPDALPRGEGTSPAAGGVLSAGTLDVVPTVGDATGQAGRDGASGNSTIDRQFTPEVSGLPSIISVVNGITIIFKRPPVP
jgi:tetratricopeptide (TPR) repeat protein